MLRISIANRQKLVRVPPALVRRALRRAAPRRWCSAELSVAVVGAREMARLNTQFTGRTGQTDVLAFPLDDAKPRQPSALVGEIVVNASLARAEARRRGTAPEDELLLYLVHGALHLAGYDDHSPAGRAAMYAREVQVLRAIGLPDVRGLCPKGASREAGRMSAKAGRGGI